MQAALRTNRPRVLALTLALGVLAPFAMPADAQIIVWKFGTTGAPGNPATDAAYECARVAAEKSQGRIRVEVFPSNQLAKGEAAHLEGVQLGTVDITTSGSAPVGGVFEPSYQALDLPFLWATREQAWKVMDGPLGQELLKKMEGKAVKGLCFGDGWGFRNMMTNKRAIATVEDMKGLTIRVQESPTYITMMKSLGANPVPMPFAELYLAMKQGTVDGMELPVTSFVSEKFYEVTKYYSMTRHSYSPIAYFVNLKKYQALPADLRQAIDEAGRAACALHRKAEVEKEKSGLEFMKKAGVQVVEVKDLKAFQDRMGPVYEAVAANVGKAFMEQLISAAKAAK